MTRYEHENDSRTIDRPPGREHRSSENREHYGRDRSRSDYSRESSSDDRRRRWNIDRDSSDREGRDSRFGPDGYREGMPRNETERLIASRKVEDTPVFDRNGNKLGTICTLMLNKRSGQTEYAVLKNKAGFLGLDERYYPLDWRELTYDTRVQGYGVDFREDELDDRVGYDVGGRPLEGRDGRRHEARYAAWS